MTFLSSCRSPSRIPILEETIDTKMYRSVGIDRNHALSDEKLVDVGDYGLSNMPYYHVSDGSNPPYNQRIEGSLPGIYVRKAIAEMLLAANEDLRSFGCELLVLDGYRPLELQKGIWDFFQAQVTKQFPDLAIEETENIVRQYVSDPRSFDQNDSTTWPTHMSGGSVDVILKDLGTERPLNLGSSFDEIGEIAHTDYFERSLSNRSTEKDREAAFNRRTLYQSMKRVGFTNYPLEFWHYDWGNQMYVAQKNMSRKSSNRRAWYGLPRLPVGHQCQPVSY